MQVKYTREAVLDADVLVRLAAVPLKNVEKLAAHTIRYRPFWSYIYVLVFKRWRISF